MKKSRFSDEQIIGMIKEQEGIDGTSPAKKDWGKTNATKSTTVSKPKDWGKKADQSKAPKKAPRPSKDMGRTCKK